MIFLRGTILTKGTVLVVVLSAISFQSSESASLPRVPSSGRQILHQDATLDFGTSTAIDEKPNEDSTSGSLGRVTWKHRMATEHPSRIKDHTRLMGRSTAVPTKDDEVTEDFFGDVASVTSKISTDRTTLGSFRTKRSPSDESQVVFHFHFPKITFDSINFSSLDTNHPQSDPFNSSAGSFFTSFNNFLSPDSSHGNNAEGFTTGFAGEAIKAGSQVVFHFHHPSIDFETINFRPSSSINSSPNRPFTSSHQIPPPPPPPPPPSPEDGIVSSFLDLSNKATITFKPPRGG